MENRDLYLYRTTAGVRKRYHFVVDEALNIISETEVSLDQAEDARSARLRAQGIKFHKEGNAIHIDHLPDQEAKILTFFQPTCICWFPGCEELHQAYLVDLKKLEDQKCLDCEKGTLINKYRDRIVVRLKELDQWQNLSY